LPDAGLFIVHWVQTTCTTSAVKFLHTFPPLRTPVAAVLVLRSEQPIAGVAESGENVADFIQLAVNGGGEDG